MTVMDGLKPHKLFLLGGYDLEMLTLKQLLEGRWDCAVADRHLQWSNAKLSAYEQELRQYTDSDIYGIELQEDIPTPENYHRIDHHNDKDTLPSALEQVAVLVGVPLNRQQQLVAANDRGYIPAMQALSASAQEMADIRRRDRAAQGVSDADERLAEESVAKHLSRQGSLLTVYSLTPCFSALCDRLFPYRQLLIYTDEEWTFYGEDKPEWTSLFAEEIGRGKIYHGGGDHGYIGAVRYAYTKEEIYKTVEKIKKKYEQV